MRSASLYTLGISGIINILALTGSFYMMQIYDRALLSGSVPTLVLISFLALGLFMFHHRRIREFTRTDNLEITQVGQRVLDTRPREGLIA